MRSLDVTTTEPAQYLHDREIRMQTTRRQFLASTAAVTATSGSPAAVPANGLQTPLFKLGMVTYNVAAQWDLATILKVCKTVGIAAVECRTTHKHGVEPSLPADRRKDIKKQFADSGIVFWGSGTVCEFHSPDPAVVKKNIESCKEFAQLVHDIGGKGVKVRPNGLPKDVPVPKTLEQIGKSLIECGNAAADVGVEVWVEVHGAGTQDPPNIKSIMEHCGHRNVGLTWNSNAADIKDGSVKWSFEMLKPWIRSCHINEIYKDASGGYPYRELFRLFREASYDRYTMIEVGRTPPDVASGEEMLRYYRALWLELTKG
jgi:sugar phosphate isomerase/epimerase